MRYTVILAGGAGTRLWPMSRMALPKQLLPLFSGHSLLQMSADRLRPLFPSDRLFVCAAERYRQAVQTAIPDLAPDNYLAEPMGRDTLSAVGLSSAILAARDPDAVLAVMTADQVIRPVDAFRELVARGCQLVEDHPEALVTFGVHPTYPATGYGYLALGQPFDVGHAVDEFREKPDLETAQRYVRAGDDAYLWNSGMFVWRASTVLDCIRRYEPEIFAGLQCIAAAWDTPRRDAVLNSLYPTFRRTSVDYAVMEPASRDSQVRVVALPMAMDWLDVGSWPTLASTLQTDDDGNTQSGGRVMQVESQDTFVASSEPDHLIVTVGLQNCIVVHTPGATLVCSADKAQVVKEIQKLVGEKWGDELI